MKYRLAKPIQVVGLRQKMRSAGLDHFSLEAPASGATVFRCWTDDKWTAGKVIDSLDGMSLLCGKPLIKQEGTIIEMSVEIRCKRVFAGEHFLLHSMNTLGGV